ncbi:MAG: BA14K family protein [Xanthobacteraceae bacterium]
MQAPGNEVGGNNCASRFRSFDPATGTYLGRDGQRHSCP